MLPFTNLIYTGVITCFNTSILIYNILNYKFILEFSIIQYLTFLSVSIYYIYMHIMEIRKKFFDSFISESNTIYTFMRDTYFRYIFYFQGYSAFYWLILFNTTYKYDLAQTDLVELFHFIFLFIALIISVFVEANKKSDSDNISVDIRNILIIYHLLCSIICIYSKWK